ncbi:IQ motif [Macleaya cordata]|uniref:IQ motif n=1 Tax=Macleaya cordata TaxID=56857 RepID=A0A200QUN1_MACCD|nr:IQ motif [Macleaya cordata]
MGKTARWFRGLLGGKKQDSSSSSSAVAGGGTSDSKPAKKKWSFVRSFRDSKELTTPSTVNNNSTNHERKGSYRESCSSSSCSYLDPTVDPNKHAIAVAAATAAVAEAAVAAAHAAAAVVKLTSSGRSTTAYVSSSSSGLRREDWAALKIQSTFRGYLARRALRALKGLVKLQALVRGHIMRKKTADTLRRMQALVRVQVRARAGRSHVSEFRYPNQKSSLSQQPGPATPEKYERGIRSNSTRHDRPSSLKRNGSNPNHRDIVDQDRVQMGWNWLDRWMDENSGNHIRESLMKTGPPDDEKSDKILEIDPGKPHLNSKFKNSFSSARHTSNTDRNSHSFTTIDSPSKDSTTAQLSAPSTSSGEVQSVRRFPREVEDAVFCTADNSPQFYSASSRHGSERRGPFTPAKSECSRSFLSGYSDYPNYMANTESSRAKVRSQSAPKQRLEFEKSSSMKRYYVHGFGELRSSSTQRGSTLHANFTSKAYPGSGRLDRLGMPARSSETIGSDGVNRNIY